MLAGAGAHLGMVGVDFTDGAILGMDMDGVIPVMDGVILVMDGVIPVTDGVILVTDGVILDTDGAITLHIIQAITKDPLTENDMHITLAE